MSDNRTIQTDEGRFEIVFRSLDELRVGQGAHEDADTMREHEGIDELRRLSADLAEEPRLSYTTTSAPTPHSAPLFTALTER